MDQRKSAVKDVHNDETYGEKDEGNDGVMIPCKPALMNIAGGLDEGFCQRDGIFLPVKVGCAGCFFLR